MVPDPKNKEDSMPRLMTYIEEKDFAPVEIIDDDKYVPTGAVLGSGMYGSANSDASQMRNNFVQNVVERIHRQQNFAESVELI